MKCILCNGPADKTSLYVPGEKSQLILGTKEPGKTHTVIFGICSDHLDENGDYKEGVKEQISQAILRRAREPNLPRINSDVDINELFDKLDGLD